MESFDPNKMSLYSIAQLIEFIKNGEVTFEELQQIGCNYMVQNEIRKFLDQRDIWENAKTSREGIEQYVRDFPDGFFVPEADKALKLLEDDETWRWAESCNSVQSYRTYLDQYPQGAHSFDAQMNIKMLQAETEKLKEELFEDMKTKPWKYKFQDMANLYNGIDQNDQILLSSLRSLSGDILARFLLSGMTLSHQELIDREIVPATMTKEDVTRPEFLMPQTRIEALGEYPQERTDVFFLGVPRSGKSSVLAGLFYQLYRDGLGSYEPHIVDGIDPCMAYYNGLVKSVGSKKPPVGTPTDTVSFMKLNINDGKRENNLTIVEMAGEAFSRSANRISDTSMRGVWELLGAEKILKNDNKKLLFFVLDYSTIRGLNEVCTEEDQLMTLLSALHTLSYDGPNPAKPQEDCTMSKVETVAIILTKSDLMGYDDIRERMREAERYITTNFRSFLYKLDEVSRKYGCNKANGYNPYFLTFSLGNFYVGNTFDFNPRDSREIIKFIKAVTPSRSVRRWSLF